MAAIEPYAPCPCGSGQKFKWCCQGVEPIADRAQRLFEGNQIEAAFQALDEGLKKTPDNPWLLTRKALYELRRGHGSRRPSRSSKKSSSNSRRHIGALGLLAPGNFGDRWGGSRASKALQRADARTSRADPVTAEPRGPRPDRRHDARRDRASSRPRSSI